MHVLAISTISDNDLFWGSLKKAYYHLPEGASWSLAVGSVDGTRAINIIVHDSIASVKNFFEEYIGSSGTTEYFAADAVNAVGLPAE